MLPLHWKMRTNFILHKKCGSGLRWMHAHAFTWNEDISHLSCTWLNSLFISRGATMAQSHSLSSSYRIYSYCSATIVLVEIFRLIFIWCMTWFFHHRWYNVEHRRMCVRLCIRNAMENNRKLDSDGIWHLMTPIGRREGTEIVLLLNIHGHALVDTDLYVLRSDATWLVKNILATKRRFIHRNSFNLCNTNGNNVNHIILEINRVHTGDSQSGYAWLKIRDVTKQISKGVSFFITIQQIIRLSKYHWIDKNCWIE